MILIGIVGLCLVAILWVLLYLYFIRRTDRFMENWEREIKEKAEKYTLKSIQSLEEVAKAIDTLPESIQSLEEASEAIKMSRRAMEGVANEFGNYRDVTLLIKTKVLLVDPERPENKEAQESARILKGGGIVSFPTETVYALGGDAYNQGVVAKIYRIKRRDRSKPLSVFLKDTKDVRKVVDFISEDAQKLMERFWPGPLTLVFKSSSPKLSWVLAGGNKLGVRVSPSKLVARILEEARVPITATSANPSGQKSCVAANRVFYFFNGRIDLILDGGKSKISLPSTVLDVSGEEVSLIRLGSIPLEEIKTVVPNVRVMEEEVRNWYARTNWDVEKKYKENFPTD
jgi:tRNA threonylcarbamoyl adenosine modification protein (Sua5/YciO/YrdC/YwlC family)